MSLICLRVEGRDWSEVVGVMLYTENLAVRSPMLELLSLRWSNGQRDIGFNLCVVPFPNICIPNFKLEGLHWRCLESKGLRFEGSEMLESK